MLLPNDFWRAAKYLVSRYGAEAGDRATLRANELREAGETNLHDIWSILAATVAEVNSRQGSDCAVRREAVLSEPSP